MRLHDMAVEAARTYLEQAGYQVLETCYESPTTGGSADIIATAKRAIHFIDVTARTEPRKGFPDQSIDRSKLENAAIGYLIENSGIRDTKVSLDEMCLLVHGNRAILRHTTGVND